jgi:DNA-binding response OmpR family regulator
MPKIPTVLIVEDEFLIAIALEELVEELGLHYLVAHSVDEALSVVATAEVDMAIVDLFLGDRDSGPVAQALKDRRIPFFICSGTEVADLSDAFDGATVLSKPYRDAEVIAAINTALPRGPSATA